MTRTLHGHDAGSLRRRDIHLSIRPRKEAYNPNPNSTNPNPSPKPKPNPNQARKEAYKLMSRDTFRRFVREDEYQCLVQELGSYKGSTSLAAMSLSNVKLEGV